MSADIRLVKLKRKAVNGKNVRNGENVGKGEIVKNGDGTITMDYFDVLEVKNFYSYNPLRDIMDIRNEGKESSDDISMQSYPLYCSEDTLKNYEGVPGYTDPFQELEDNGMPYLSIIQVHITPEVFARLYCNKETEYLSCFLNDLHEILLEFIREEKPEIGFRIYQSLAVGDFAVVIRSKKADTSFYISSAIRRRIAKNRADSEINLVLYKTYTVLSLFNQVIPEISSNGSEGEKSGKFVIRCCFANKYWGRIDEVKQELEKVWCDKCRNYVLRLNGRYDFSMELVPLDFERLFPVICRYKGLAFEGADAAIKKMEDKLRKGEAFDNVDYLCYLLQNGYLSYVNERYLLSPEECVTDTVKRGSAIEVNPVEDENSFLAQLNHIKFEELEKRFQNLKERLFRVNGFRKNMHYYFMLLQKLCYLCQTINGLSDTRIYSAILLKQIEILLDGIEYYFNEMTESGTIILDDLEVYLRESVCALDSYAKYIRNNNLQSLQTPNYSLQSNASMEKLLVGYGEMLSELIQNYQRHSSKEVIGVGAANFFPVLIPVLSNGELSIEIMFRNTPSENNENRTKLMLVKCSTLQELTNVPEMQASFFHEVAHQFRYESREERNKILLHYSIFYVFKPIVEELFTEVRYEVEGMNDCLELEKALLTAVDKAFCKVWQAYFGGNGVCQKSLEGFKIILEKLLRAVWSEQIMENEWKISREQFVESLREAGLEGHYLNLDDRAVQDAVKAFEELDEKLLLNGDCKISESEYERQLNLNITTAEKAACFLWMYCHNIEKAKVLKENWRKLDIHKEMDICRESRRTKEYEALDYVYQSLEKMRSKTAEDARLQNFREIFLNALYEEAVDEWSRNESYEKHRAVSRFLCIDSITDENKKEFKKIFGFKMSAMKTMVLDAMEDSIAIYREQTADIYMCTMLRLTPFGYLNYMAYNLPTDLGIEIDPVYVSRFLSVIFSFSNTDDLKEEETGRVFYEIGEAICCNLKTLLDNRLKEENCKEAEALRKALHIPEQAAEADSWIYKLVKGMETLRESCKKLRSHLLTQSVCLQNEEILQQELLHYQYLSNILLKLLFCYADSELYLNGYEHVKEDLKNGASNWKTLLKELEKQEWWQACCKCGEILNSPSILYDQNRTGMIYDELISFIQTMYYRNKQKSGREILNRGKVKEK